MVDSFYLYYENKRNLLLKDIPSETFPVVEQLGYQHACQDHSTLLITLKQNVQR